MGHYEPPDKPVKRPFYLPERLKRWKSEPLVEPRAPGVLHANESQCRRESGTVAILRMRRGLH